jgi:CDP-glucose 4,6-dehydratase
MNKKFFNGIYNNKRVLVTGHTGFKGSWLTAWLHELGAEVLGYSLYLPSEPCHFEALRLEGKIKHIVGDVRDKDHLNKVFDDFKPQIVFHMAAQPLVRSSYENPKETFDTNLGGTVNLLDILRVKDSVEAAVFITSDKCYENIGIDVGYKEDDQLGGADPYSASKACAEIAFSSFFRSFFNKEGVAKIATARAGNVIGGGDWAKDRIVPDCVKAWSQSEKPIIRKPDATRPWQHVLEPLSGYLWLGAYLAQNKKEVLGQSYNFGPDSNVVKSVGELADAFLKYWGKGSWEHVPHEGEKKEAKLLKLSIEKAHKDLAWQPTLDFDQTMQFTAQWYKNFYDNQDDIYAYTQKQIENYIQQAQEKNLPWTQNK